jgi:putative spermidine/putrescine transport system ATP-binding protein
MPGNDPGLRQHLAAQPAPAMRVTGERVVITNLTKRYRDTLALDDVSLEVAPGELVTILGPSGSGKTTTLMIIAGFSEGAYSGEVRVGDRRIDHLPPNLRGIGMVFQHLELFPHMSVEDNIAFPLRMRGLASSVVKERLQGALELVRLTSMAKRLPAQLSGGQRQRVALARAVVYAPPVLLLDEPFGALDKNLREDMQAELRSLNRRLGITVIHVTHDQIEAMAISDRVVVMNAGRIEQVGTPHQIYFAPRTRFVGAFVGESVFLDGRVVGTSGPHIVFETNDGVRSTARPAATLASGAAVAANGSCAMMLRPQSLRLLDADAVADNRVAGTVTGSTFAGDKVHYDMEIGVTSRVTVAVPVNAMSPLLPAGSKVMVGWNADDALVI